MASDFDFNALFEDPSSAGFGCVLFDMTDSGDGKLIPVPGKGWASIAGGTVQRINSVDDLDSSIKWLSNLDRATFWRTGCVRLKKLRESSFLKTDLGQIMREVGIVPKRMTTAAACVALSEIFSRTMSWAMLHYDVDELAEQEWIDEVRSRLFPLDNPISMEVDEALRRSYVDYIVCGSPRLDGGRLVTLRRPRVAHAKSVLGTAIPQGEWTFIQPDSMPDEHARLEWFWQMQKPVLAKVAIKGFGERCPAHVPPLLQLGEALGEGGRKKERNWMSLQEIKYFSRYAKVEIQAAFVADGWASFHGAKKILELGDLSNFSISLGLLAESHWMSLAGRSRNPATRSKNLVSPRASWFRATDRFLCFCSALPLAAAGFTVVSYGGGCVSVAVRPESMAELAEVAAACGLIVPAVLFGTAGRVNQQS